MGALKKELFPYLQASFFFFFFGAGKDVRNCIRCSGKKQMALSNWVI